MATSDVQIAKLALSHVGDRFDITNLSQATTEAEQVNLVFADAREALQREHPWKFTLYYTSPAVLSGTPPAEWTYQYAYPPDALRVWRIVNPLGRDLPPIPFTVGNTAAGTRVLLTDMSEPEFEYTKRITNPGLFTDDFEIALSWRIAQLIARPLTGDDGVVDRVKRDGDYWVSHMKAQDANEGVTPEDQTSRDPDWIRARN